MGLTYSSLTAFSIAVVAVAALALLKSLFRRRLLKDIQGPPSNSFWLGTYPVHLFLGLYSETFLPRPREGSALPE